MALATQCPHCHTTFRVASDQLKLRGGIVRCGTCQRIFDGNAHLIDLAALAAAKKTAEAVEAVDASAAAAPADAEAAAAAPSPAVESPAAESPAAQSPAATAPALPEPEAAEDAIDFGNQPVYTLDFDHTFDPFGILPKVEPTFDAEPAAQPGLAVADTVADETAEAAPDDLPPAPDVQAEAEAPAEPSQERIEPVIEPVIEPGPGARMEPEFGPLPDEDAATQAHEAAAEAPEPAAPQAEPETEPEPEPAPEPEPESEPAPEPEPEPAPVPAYAYAPAGRIEPSFDLPIDEELVAQPLPGHEPEAEPEPEPKPPAEAAHAVDAAHAAFAPSQPAPLGRSLQADIPSGVLPLRASADIDAPPHPAHGEPPPAPRSARAKAVEARTRRSKMTPTRIEAPKLRVPAEPDEPEFVKRSRRQEESGRLARILMAAGAVVLLLVLAVQLLLNFRNELALRYPAARPLLSGLCFVAGCRVGLPAQAENLAIDDGELATLGPDTYSLNTQLRNQGGLALAWPSIELELTDANNKPLLRRVFGPADYLPPGTALAAGFGAHAEQPIRLNFALTDLKPSGYHTFVFYP